jgi:hypothetical protein
MVLTTLLELDVGLREQSALEQLGALHDPHLVGMKEAATREPGRILSSG